MSRDPRSTREKLVAAIEDVIEDVGGSIGGSISICTERRGCFARAIEAAGGEAGPEECEDCPFCKEVAFDEGLSAEEIASRVFPN